MAEIESLPIADLHEDPANVRRHPERNLAGIKASLARFGQQKPIVVDGNNIVRAGNGTLAAARELGWDRIDCIRTGLKGSEATAYAIADNRTAELAEWDETGLAETLRSLQSEDFDLSTVGYTDEEVDGILEGLAADLAGALGAEDPGAQVDRADELLKKWKVETGQLWVIPSNATPGREHRLLCGDSTKTEDVARVMGGEKAVLMNTDPPYGVDYAAVKNGIPRSGFRDIQARGGDIENDDLTDGATLQAFLEQMIRAAVPHLTENPAFYLWHPMLTQGTFFAAAAAAADILIHRQIIWVKPHMVLTRSGMYHWKHELCFYGWVRGQRCPWYGDKSQVSVWELGESQQGRNHPTQKPVELFTRPILNHSKPGQIAYEPFSGSGSQYVASEQTGRLCYGLELAPKYVAVALERLANMGLEPQISSTGTGP